MVNRGSFLHITNTDSALVDFCKAQGIQVEAYSPIAHGEALKNPAIVKMAVKYGVSAAQLCIRYVLQLGAVALPKTAHPPTWKATRTWISRSPRKTWKLSRTWSASPTMVNSAHFPCSAESLLHEEKA